MAAIRVELDRKAKKQRGTVTQADVLDSAMCRCRRCYSMIEQQMTDALVPAVIRALQAEPVSFPNSPGTHLSPQDIDQLLAMVFAHQLRREVRQQAKTLINNAKHSANAVAAVNAYLADLQVSDRDVYASTYHHICSYIDLNDGLGDYGCDLHEEGLFRPCPFLGKDVEHAVHACINIMENAVLAERAEIDSKPDA